MKLLRGKADPKQVSAALLEALKIDRWFERHLCRNGQSGTLFYSTDM